MLGRSRSGKVFSAVACALAVSAVIVAAPARAEVNEVRIGVQFGLIYLPVIVAETQGFFAEEAKKAGLSELKVTVERFSGSPAVTDAVLSGNADIGAFGTPGLLIAWEKTKGHQEIAGLAALGANAFFLETNKPQIKSLADFKDGDQIAVPATTSPQAVVMRMAAEKTFGDYKHIDKLLVAMPHPDATAALLSGQVIAGYVATAPFTAMLKKSDKVHIVTTSKDILGEEMTGVALGVGKKFVDANPIVARVVIAAVEDGMKFMAKDPAAAADIYLKSEASKTPKSDTVDLLTDGSIAFSVAPTGLIKLANFMAKAGELKAAPKSWQDVFFPLLGDRQGS
ncbi:MAG TPA: ABC transporter substrate-binding protein [Xanthobacteraceae bacterium]|jgi:NitT/TauT family transport system substrate-binding protein|nr:ABC transporter substrate-binding protein [Xanthobacteraceae bacterium]